MVDPFAALLATLAMVLLALVAWTVSLLRRDVSVVDSFWSLFFLVGALVYASSGFLNDSS